MNAEQLAGVMPECDVGVWLDPLQAGMAEFNILSTAQQAAFLATLAVESDQLRVMVENLNYSAIGLAATWPRRYALAPGKPNALAYALARKPEAIANNVYADRMGNGPEQSGDGWMYRGSGPIQITGKDNHLVAATAFGIDLALVGYYLRSPRGGARSAARFWHMAGCGKFADAGDFDGVCDMVNLGRHTDKIGDAMGYADRVRFHNVALKILGA